MLITFVIRTDIFSFIALTGWYVACLIHNTILSLTLSLTLPEAEAELRLSRG